MINKLANINLDLQVTSVYDFNELTLQELLCKFFSKINECVDVSNQALNFLTWLKEEGLPIEVQKEIEKMYLDGRLTEIINQLANDVKGQVTEIKQDLTNHKAEYEQFKTSTNETLTSHTSQLEQNKNKIDNINTNNNREKEIDLFASTMDTNLDNYIRTDTTEYTVYINDKQVYFPTITMLGTTYYCAFRSANTHASDIGSIIILSSTDRRTWNKIKEITTSNKDLRDPQLFVNGTRLFIKYFEYYPNDDSQRQSYLIYSDDNGVNWSNKVALPTIDGQYNSTKGNVCIKGNEIYIVNYVINGDEYAYAYTIKSSDNGLSWINLGYITKDYKLSEVSICYLENFNKFFIVARQHIFKDDVTPNRDYRNYMIVAESSDCITWTNFKEIPLYGHAPSLVRLNNEKMLLTFKNTDSTININGKYYLSTVVMKGSEIYSQVFNIHASSIADSHYCDCVVDGGKNQIHVVYHVDRSQKVLLTELNLGRCYVATRLSHAHLEDSNKINKSLAYINNSGGTSVKSIKQFIGGDKEITGDGTASKEFTIDLTNLNLTGNIIGVNIHIVNNNTGNFVINLSEITTTTIKGIVKLTTSSTFSVPIRMQWSAINIE